MLMSSAVHASQYLDGRVVVVFRRHDVDILHQDCLAGRPYLSAMLAAMMWAELMYRQPWR